MDFIERKSQTQELGNWEIFTNDNNCNSARQHLNKMLDMLAKVHEKGE